VAATGLCYFLCAQEYSGVSVFVAGAIKGGEMMFGGFRFVSTTLTNCELVIARSLRRSNPALTLPRPCTISIHHCLIIHSGGRRDNLPKHEVVTIARLLRRRLLAMTSWAMMGKIDQSPSGSSGVISARTKGLAEMGGASVRKVNSSCWRRMKLYRFRRRRVWRVCEGA